MTTPLPENRSTANTKAEHIADHNLLAALYNQSGVPQSKQATATVAYENILTLPTTPRTDSLMVFKGKEHMTLGTDYTLSGAVLTFTQGLASGTKITAYYESAANSASAAVLSGSSGPAFRTPVVNNFTTGQTIGLPSGTVAGDRIIVFLFTPASETAPNVTNTGYVDLQTGSTFGGHRISSKIADSSDIATGSLTLNGSGTITAAVTSTPLPTVVNLGFARTQTANSGTMTALAPVNAGDSVLWYGFGRIDTASNNTAAPVLARGTGIDIHLRNTNVVNALLMRAEIADTAIAQVTNSAAIQNAQVSLIAGVAVRTA